MRDSQGLFEVFETGLAGCLVLQPVVRKDARGVFVKTFHEGAFRELGLPEGFREEYYSISSHNVLRGMHFQVPPSDCGKLVCCLEGRIWDVALDLRRTSPTFGKFHFLELDSGTGRMMYLSEGFAHGFYTMSPQALVAYHVTQVYDRERDTGIRWDSAGIPWPCEAPLLSERDLGLPPFSEFDTPFA